MTAASVTAAKQTRRRVHWLRLAAVAAAIGLWAAIIFTVRSLWS